MKASAEVCSNALGFMVDGLAAVADIFSNHLLADGQVASKFQAVGGHLGQEGDLLAHNAI